MGDSPIFIPIDPQLRDRILETGTGSSPSHAFEIVTRLQEILQSVSAKVIGADSSPGIGSHYHDDYNHIAPRVDHHHDDCFCGDPDDPTYVHFRNGSPCRSLYRVDL